MLRFTLAFLAMLFAAGCVTSGGSMNSDTVSGWTFRKDTLSKTGYAYSVVNKSDGHPVRSGEQSLRFEVRPGDCRVSFYWDDCGINSERSERIETKLYGNLGEKWYHWSIYLPEDYPVIWQTKVLLGQFHDNTIFVPWKFRIVGKADVKNRRYIETYSLDSSLVGGTGSDELIDVDEMRGNWTDVLVHAKWTATRNGFMRVYVNGSMKPAYSWAGITRHPKRGDSFFKFGIYRPMLAAEAPTQIVYYDDVRRGRTCAEVTEYFPCAEIVGGSS